MIMRVLRGLKLKKESTENSWRSLESKYLVNFVERWNSMSDSKTPYMYAFVRKDLPAVQQIIQVAHAVDELRRDVNHHTDVSHLILFEVANERELHYVHDFLDKQGVTNHMFYEPDVQQFTAIATEQLVGEQRALMSGFKMYRK